MEVISVKKGLDGSSISVVFSDSTEMQYSYPITGSGGEPYRASIILWLETNTPANAYTLSELKELKLVECSSECESILSKSDKFYVRFTDTGEAVPADIQTYRDAVRVSNVANKETIDAATDYDLLAAFNPSWPQT